MSLKHLLAHSSDLWFESINLALLLLKYVLHIHTLIVLPLPLLNELVGPKHIIPVLGLYSAGVASIASNHCLVADWRLDFLEVVHDLVHFLVARGVCVVVSVEDHLHYLLNQVHALEHVIHVLNDLVGDHFHLVFQLVELVRLSREIALKHTKSLLLLFGRTSFERREILTVLCAYIRLDRLILVRQVAQLLLIGHLDEADRNSRLELGGPVLQPLEVLHLDLL